MNIEDCKIGTKFKLISTDVTDEYLGYSATEMFSIGNVSEVIDFGDGYDGCENVKLSDGYWYAVDDLELLKVPEKEIVKLTVSVSTEDTNEIAKDILKIVLKDLNVIISDAIDSLSNDSLSNDSLSNDSLSNDSLSNDSLSNDSLSNDSLSNDSLSNDSLSNDSLSNDSLSNDSLSNDSLSNDSLSNDSLSNDSLSNDSLSNDSLSNDSLSNDSLSNDKDDELTGFDFSDEKLQHLLEEATKDVMKEIIREQIISLDKQDSTI